MVSKVALGEVCDFIRGVAFDGDESIDLPKEGYVPILRAGNIGDELYIRDDLVWVPEKRVSKEQLFQIGDIAICMASGSPAVLGKTAQLNENFMGSVGAFCGIIRPTKADPNYIAYWLKSPTFMAWRDSQANGVNIQNLRPSEIQEIQIHLPELPEQQRVSALLARAERLGKLRRTTYSLVDELLESVFFEMFGDPLANNKRWAISKLSEAFAVKPQIGTPDPAHAGGKYPVVRVGEIGNTTWVELERSQKITLDDKGLERFRLQTGDFLLARAIGSENHLGKASILQETNQVVVHDSHVMRLRFNEKVVLPFFFLHWLKSDGGRARFMQKAGRTAVQFNVNTEQIADIDLPLPPLNLQEEFAGVVARVESLRGRMSESERQVEGLFESLLAESFREDRPRIFHE